MNTRSLECPILGQVSIPYLRIGHSRGGWSCLALILASPCLLVLVDSMHPNWCPIKGDQPLVGVLNVEQAGSGLARVRGTRTEKKVKAVAPVRVHQFLQCPSGRTLQSLPEGHFEVTRVPKYIFSELKVFSNSRCSGRTSFLLK